VTAKIQLIKKSVKISKINRTYNTDNDIELAPRIPADTKAHNTLNVSLFLFGETEK